MTLNYVDHINRSIQFIETHLHDPDLNLDRISAHSGYSKYHYQRLFHVITNETVGQYVLKRRLTKAAIALSTSKQNVLDIALSCGFETHESFTRAFRKRFGIPPSQYKKVPVTEQLLLRNPITIDYLRNIENISLSPESIRSMRSLPLVGLQLEDNGQQEIQQVWTRIMLGTVPRCSYGIVEYPDEFRLNWTYLYTCAFEQGEEPSGLAYNWHKLLPETTYLVFHHTGAVETLPLTFEYIFGAWLPQSEWEISHPYCFERYDERFLGASHPESITEIYIPVQASADKTSHE